MKRRERDAGAVQESRLKLSLMDQALNNYEVGLITQHPAQSAIPKCHDGTLVEKALMAKPRESSSLT